jgi:hypothetical protein
MNPKSLLVLKNLTVPTDMIISSGKKAQARLPHRGGWLNVELCGNQRLCRATPDGEAQRTTTN